MFTHRFPALKRNALSAATAVTLSVGFAATPASAHESPVAGLTPDSHAPAGVMYDHMHKKGGWMIGYTYSHQNTGGAVKRDGRSVDDHALTMAGYTMKPTGMQMNMHMLHLMYAPSDAFNLMVMPMYMDMPMTMQGLSGGHGGHGRHGGGHGTGGGEMSHGASGLGDTVAAGLFRLYDDGRHHLHAGLGISMPTGSVSRRNGDSTFAHYGMQMGTGTWDAIPSITYTGQMQRWSWGAQALAKLPMQHANRSGYRVGNRFEANAWGAFRLTPWLSASARLNYTAQGAIRGAYDGPVHVASPDDLPGNYGGRVLKVGAGLNAVFRSGPLKGHRIGVEYLTPVAQNLNGYQLEQRAALYANWSIAF
ncbi:hypothetical protein [Burkholderia cepacia]|uniref:hypothetical protein n=1 Tax=Burkholderia cepacia TaxID=292 RepID=UPI00069E78BC|nr:hypothetical protein [Burkholderia cepacia]